MWFTKSSTPVTLSLFQPELERRQQGEVKGRSSGCLGSCSEWQGKPRSDCWVSRLPVSSLDPLTLALRCVDYRLVSLGLTQNKWSETQLILPLPEVLPGQFSTAAPRKPGGSCESQSGSSQVSKSPSRTSLLSTRGQRCMLSYGSPRCRNFGDARKYLHAFHSPIFFKPF